MSAISNYFNGIKRDYSALEQDKSREGRNLRISSLAARIIGGAGLAVVAGLFVAGLSVVSTVSGALPLIVATVAFTVLFHDLIAVGMNRSARLHDKSSTVLNPCLNTASDYQGTWALRLL